MGPENVGLNIECNTNFKECCPRTSKIICCCCGQESISDDELDAKINKRVSKELEKNPPCTHNSKSKKSTLRRWVINDK